MTLQWPRISIVMPSFNQVAFIERAINSVLSQDYSNKELIIINGGSTDGSVEIITKYEKHLAYWVSEKDRGQTHALNKGFSRARGDIAAWLNSDDMYPLGSLSTAASVFREYPDLDIVYGNMNIIDVNDNVIGEMRYTRLWYPMVSLLGNVLPQPPAFWRRSLFDRIGYLDESLRFAMDYDFMCRAAEVARVRHIRRCTSLFRSQPGQKSQTINEVGDAESAAARARHVPRACGRVPRSVMFAACHIARMVFLS